MMRRLMRLPRAVFFVGLMLSSCSFPALACSIGIPKKGPPTVAEQMAGLTTIFGGTVVGWELENGKRLMGKMPDACMSQKFGGYDWISETRTSQCQAYWDVSAALFRVDTPIVGPVLGAIVPVYMTWGDGDCNNDFNWGEQWFIAGQDSHGRIVSDLLSEDTQQFLREPISPEEITALRKMAAKPRLYFQELNK